NPSRLPRADWALVTNDAARTADGRPSRQALLAAGLRIRRLFSPEHGIHAIGEDGAPQPDGHDPLTGLPVASLYGDRWAPRSEQLADIDAVLFDIPDIGCRFYTYLWTLTHVMEACAAAGRPLFVADRPNPIGTVLDAAEGPGLDETRCSSFIGRWDIPLKHACTLGELARYFKHTRLPALELHVVPVPGMKRGHARLSDTFHPTSPAMPSLQTALLYPGLGLLEGVNINEGRGTDKPFTRFGAPWLDPAAVIRQLDAEARAGLELRQTSYRALTGPHASEDCLAIEAEVTDPARLMSVRTGIALLRALQVVHGDRLMERPYPTQASPTGRGHLDRLLGQPGSFSRMRENSLHPDGIADGWTDRMRPFLLYP
ncbi:MAG: DUF1343 domain-containing protein, partial [Chitinophagia bacterium]|nr:DUF1343 domain-containing protein [Chitinophagia bacterium]